MSENGDTDFGAGMEQLGVVYADNKYFVGHAGAAGERGGEEKKPGNRRCF